MVGQQIESLQKWLEKRDVRLPAGLYFGSDATCGTSIFTKDTLPAGTCAIDLPSDLPITSTFSYDAICDSVGISPDQRQQEKEIVDATFAQAGVELVPADWVVLHLLLVRLLLDEGLVHVTSDGDAKMGLKGERTSIRPHMLRLIEHAPYINAIPYPEIALTPLHFNDAELRMLRGTSLFGATVQRRSRGEKVVDTFSKWLAHHCLESLSSDITEERFLSASLFAGTGRLQRLWRWADTSFGSRSFPSRILGIDDEANPSFGAVLVPGLDSFNHQRGRRVTWQFDRSSHSSNAGRTRLILDTPTEAGTQVFNNYGAKSTEELLGSYGFVLKESVAKQDDALGLLISAKGDVPASGSSLHWWKHGADQGPPPALIDEIRNLLRSGDAQKPRQGESSELDQIEEDGEVYAALEDMLHAKLQAFCEGPGLPADEFSDSQGSVRPAVSDMVAVYRKGQEEILEQAIRWTESKLQELEQQWSQLEDATEGQ
ncbi:hypothetical protein OC846_003145 [Tilletia horrida]|uniref:SET domain-containing protein n=1 Tax=Tilletia horrida TaxID=155126 RepID=A0AAN6JRK2_9BASI|nr:hypothetical protein OC845_003779 [Tilletia horrida]KAK0551859.1 hypothetical protein OC846_003145 [Tilletia horrida]KAK0561098.1 hypothetical protein OC861_005988 [Tilletia horrida]